MYWDIINLHQTYYRKWNPVSYCILINRYKSRPIPSKDMQSPSAQKWQYLHERCPQCWIEWKIRYFQFWVMTDYIYNLRWHTRCAIDQNKMSSKVAKFAEKMRIATRIFVVPDFFVRLLDLRYELATAPLFMQNRPYPNNWRTKNRLMN